MASFVRKVTHQLNGCRRISWNASGVSNGRIVDVRFMSSAQVDDNPLQVVNEAIGTLATFSDQLRQLSATIRSDVTLPSTGQVVTLKDIVIHSRDSDPADFAKPAAAEARRHLLQTVAEPVESELQEMVKSYQNHLLPKMEKSAQICQASNCGGATWEMDLGNATESQTIRLEGKETPCWRLHEANLAFLEMTYDTKQDMILGSRAALLLRLSCELNLPLTTIRNDKEAYSEQNQRIKTVFSQAVVPTPWIRSDEQYKQFFELKQELLKNQ